MIQSLLRYIVQWIRALLSSLQDFWRRSTAPTIQFDSGRSVCIGKQIAEGGFSFVFEATDATKRNKKYALKRIHVGDRDGLQACMREAGIHRGLPQHHPHLMPLLGLCQEPTTVYMLFPYIPLSLRAVVNQSIFQKDPMRKPFTELKVLQLIHQIMSAVSAMHETNFSHRDIKLENILMNGNSTPVLMDFGSVGSLEEPLQHRSQLLSMIETASQHTTMPYRPPELLEGGGVRAGSVKGDVLDYTKVDVWSLGCTLFAMCFGASPFECEFRKAPGSGNKTIRIVECTQLRILGNPMPPSSMPPTDWYSPLLLETIRLFLTPDRHDRPTLDEAMVEIEALIQKQGGRVPKVVLRKGIGSVAGLEDDEGDDDKTDLDALLSSNRYGV
jgi:serine/threonine kinase 16